jgi:hypothetical protein
MVNLLLNKFNIDLHGLILCYNEIRAGSMLFGALGETSKRGLIFF